MKKVKNILKKFVFTHIMSTISFFISIFFVYLSKGDDWSYRYIIILLGSFPFLCYLLITILSNVFANKKYTKIISSLLFFIITFFLAVYYAGMIFVCAFIEAEHPVKNIKHYKDYVNSDYLLKVFPKKIPNDVENIKLIYSPGILQGGTELALYFVDNNLDMGDFDSKYREKADWIGYQEQYSEKEGLLIGIFSDTLSVYGKEDDFKIYLIEGSCDNSGYCNHGSFLIVAVNNNTKEVIYKSEDW